MRSLVIALVLGVSLTAAAAARFAPGQTAPSDPRVPRPMVIHGPTPGAAVLRDVSDIRDEIDRGRDAGALSKQEARQLRRESRTIGVLAERYGRDGLSDAEKTELETRALYLRDAVNVARTR